MPEKAEEANVKIVCQAAQAAKGSRSLLTIASLREKVALREAVQGEGPEMYTDVLVARTGHCQADTPDNPAATEAEAALTVAAGLNSNFFVLRGNTLHTAPTPKDASRIGTRYSPYGVRAATTVLISFAECKLQFRLRAWW